jgi:hypothetical protein
MIVISFQAFKLFGSQFSRWLEEGCCSQRISWLTQGLGRQSQHIFYSLTSKTRFQIMLLFSSTPG